MRIIQSVDIIAPPERVWPFLTNPRDILKWCETFQTCDYSSGRHSGVGVSFHVEEKAGGPLLNLEFTVTEWAVNRVVAMVMTKGNFVKAYVQRWVIVPWGGGSRFIFMENVKFPYGAIGDLMGRFGRSRSEAHVEAMLAKLKTLAESSRADLARAAIT